MNLYDTQNLGLVQRIWKRTSSTINTYILKDVISDLNDSLDWYFSLAFRASLGWEFDDSNKTSPPIDTQDLVSGTNRYKFSAFTEKIINLIKLEVLDSSGKGRFLIPETFNTMGSPTIGTESGVIPGVTGRTFQDLYLSSTSNSGVPTHYCKFGDFVYLRPFPNYNYTAGLEAYFNRPASKFTFNTATVTIATPGVFSATSHGLVAGDTVILETTGALPTGLSADTVYYVISAGLTANAFELATTAGGSAINTTGSQSGTHYFIKLNASPGFQETHHQFLVTYASKTRLNDTNQALLGTLPSDVLLAERTIKDDYTLKRKDVVPRLSVRQENNR